MAAGHTSLDYFRPRPSAVGGITSGYVIYRRKISVRENGTVWALSSLKRCLRLAEVDCPFIATAIRFKSASLLKATPYWQDEENVGTCVEFDLDNG